MASGCKIIMLSIMPMGAGSSADSALPSLPTTDSTSGTLAMARSCHGTTMNRSRPGVVRGLYLRGVEYGVQHELVELAVCLQSR